MGQCTSSQAGKGFVVCVLNNAHHWYNAQIVAVMNPEPKEMSVLRKEVEGATTTLHSINQMVMRCKYCAAILYTELEHRCFGKGWIALPTPSPKECLACETRTLV